MRVNGAMICSMAVGLRNGSIQTVSSPASSLTVFEMATASGCTKISATRAAGKIT